MIPRGHRISLENVGFTPNGLSPRADEHTAGLHGSHINETPRGRQTPLPERCEYRTSDAQDIIGRVLAAELAMPSGNFQSDDKLSEGPEGLDVAQTKLDYQPW